MFFFFFLFNFLHIATLNVNGLCTVNKQQKLHSFSSYNKIDILLIQKHNVKSLTVLDYLATYFKIILNPTIFLKGGIAILIDKKLDIAWSKIYLHPSSRISKVTLMFQNIQFDLICVYTHSGHNFDKVREEVFEGELLTLIHCNPGKMVIGGDWNCIISKKDSSHPKNSCFSKSLKKYCE